jgi:hypothetical protein
MYMNNRLHNCKSQAIARVSGDIATTMKTLEQVGQILGWNPNASIGNR